jgi:hypothetical protein
MTYLMVGKERINLTSFNLVPGYIQELQFLVKTRNDLKKWYNYWRDVGKRSIISLREDKLKENEISYDQFEKMYQEDKIGALEKLFQHPVGRQDVEQLEKKVLNNNYSIQELYQKHIKCATLPLQRFIK